MEQIKKNKVLNVFKYISLGIALVTYGFIFYQCSLAPTESKSWESWASNIWKNLLNDTFKLKEDVKIVNPESISLGQNDYLYNSIDGYEDDEIPLGCAKQLSASISPSNTTNGSVSFVASPSENVNLVQKNNTVTVEALKLGEVTINAISNADDTLVSQFKYNVVDKIAPVSFSTSNQNLTIKQGKSSLISVDCLNTKINSGLMLSRYYDINKLSISSSDESVVSIRKPYLKAVNAGTATVTISNGSISKRIDVIVDNSSLAVVPVTSFDIKGDDIVHIMGVDKNEHTKLSIDWGEHIPTDTNVIWSVTNSPAAIVTQDGEVMGYRKVHPTNDVEFVVRATSVDNPSVYKDFNMKLCHVSPTSISLESSLSIDFNGNYILNTGKSADIKVNYGNDNVTKKGYSISVTDNSIVSAFSSGDSVRIVGLKEGNTTLVVKCLYDENVKSQNFNITVATRDYINEDNKDSFSFAIRKYISGHAFLFMIGSVFTTIYLLLTHLSKPKKILVPAVACTILIGFGAACLSEYIQTFVPGRVGVWSDVGIDLIGYSIGIFIDFCIVGIYLLVKKCKKDKNIE